MISSLKNQVDNALDGCCSMHDFYNLFLQLNTMHIS